MGENQNVNLGRCKPVFDRLWWGAIGTCKAFMATWMYRSLQGNTYMVYMAARTYTAIRDTGVYVNDHKGVRGHKGLPRHKLSQGHVEDTWLLSHVEAYMAFEVCGVIDDNRHVQRDTRPYRDVQNFTTTTHTSQQVAFFHCLIFGLKLGIPLKFYQPSWMATITRNHKNDCHGSTAKNRDLQQEPNSPKLE